MKEWWTAQEIADAKLPELPIAKRSVNNFAARKGWKERRTMQGNPLFRKRVGSGDGWEYNYCLFPELAQIRLLQVRQEMLDMANPSEQRLQSALQKTRLWGQWENKSAKQKDKAQLRLNAILQVQEFVRAGNRKDISVRLVARDIGCGHASIYNWIKKVQGKPRDIWLPLLCSSKILISVDAEFSPEAWGFLKVDYLRTEKPSFTECYTRLKSVAHLSNWAVPSATIVRQRIDEIPSRVIAILRDGENPFKTINLELHEVTR